MEIVQINIETYSGITCPETEKYIPFDPDDYESTPKLQDTVIKGVLNSEIPNECLAGLQPFSDQWSECWKEMENKWDEDEWLSLDEMVQQFSSTKYKAIKVSVPGIAGGVYYYVIDNNIKVDTILYSA